MRKFKFLFVCQIIIFGLVRRGNSSDNFVISLVLMWLMGLMGVLASANNNPFRKSINILELLNRFSVSIKYSTVFPFYVNYPKLQTTRR